MVASLFLVPVYQRPLGALKRRVPVVHDGVHLCGSPGHPLLWIPSTNEGVRDYA